MTATNSPQTGKTSTDSPDADRGMLLYLPFRTLPTDAEEMLNRLSDASGIQPADLRYKMVGQGMTCLTPRLPREKQDLCVREMQDMGIPAAVVSEKPIRRRLKLPISRKVEISDDAVVFLDRNDAPVLTVDDSTDLIAIIADLSGKVVEKPHIALTFDQPVRQRTFEEALKKMSVSEPAVVFCHAGADKPSAVLVDHSIFAYRSLEDYMAMSASVNFRTLINETISRANTVVTDHQFGVAALPGAKPDWQGGKSEILATLNRYTRYILAAADARLIQPGGQTAADDAYAQKMGDRDAEEAGAADSETDPQASGKPHPPPEIERSGIMGRIAATPYETIYGAVFGLAPFLWFFLNVRDLDNPVFWKTVFGILLVGAGLFLFPYSLLLLHYKRMVQNTPTSKVRSVAMGMAELEGRARQYYDLRSSHSKTKCIFYRCRYYKKHRTREGTEWRLTRETYSGRLPFYLEDDTGRVLVRPNGAHILASKTRQEFWGNQSMWLSPALQDRNTKIIEELIPAGTSIYVLGAAQTERVGSTFKQTLIEKLRALKSDPQRLMQYDADGDGRIDETEWETARTDMENIMHAESLMNDTGPKERAVIRKPLYGMLPFMIADAEPAIVRKLSIRVWLFMIGGLVMIGLGIELLIRLYAG